ncbi:hypothetical protein IAQ61_010179 [Plenodomus lingam]|uniref:uncharacterized protein n=1 Tax=Leptosphaeria maculans TaxID=5022 RepID=UPI00333317DA|nr:hypothetical protein IAQ61_010179 [Plenodomus lingam]
MCSDARGCAQPRREAQWCIGQGSFWPVRAKVTWPEPTTWGDQLDSGHPGQLYVHLKLLPRIDTSTLQHLDTSTPRHFNTSTLQHLDTSATRHLGGTPADYGGKDGNSKSPNPPRAVL